MSFQQYLFGLCGYYRNINIASFCFVKIYVVNIRFELRSSHPEVFYKKAVFRNFAIFTGKHLCWSLFFKKLAFCQACNFTKKRLQYRCFSVNIAKFLRTLPVLLLLFDETKNLQPYVRNLKEMWNFKGRNRLNLKKSHKRSTIAYFYCFSIFFTEKPYPFPKIHFCQKFIEKRCYTPKS